MNRAIANLPAFIAMATIVGACASPTSSGNANPPGTDGAAQDAAADSSGNGVTDAGGASSGGAIDAGTPPDDTGSADGPDSTQGNPGTGDDAGPAKQKENTDELCKDGKDNDGNGYTDCNDFGCSKNKNVTVCKGSGGTGKKENTDALCKDGKDNDGNGYTDCDDFGCSKNKNVTVCKGGGTGGPNSCVGKCGKYDDKAKCQCDEDCLDFDDCCSDYKKVCAGKPVCGNGKCESGETIKNCEKDCKPGSCKGKCGKYDAAAKCQCDDQCKDLGDCCGDFVKLCGEATKTGGGGTTDPGSGELVISEMMIRSQSGADEGEWIELYNPATAAVPLAGYALVYKKKVKVELKAAATLSVPGHGFFVIGRTSDGKKNHGAQIDLVQKTIQLGNSGGDLELQKNGKTIDKVHYIKTDVTLGVAWQLSAGKLTSKANDDPKNWCAATKEFGTAKKKGTPNGLNHTCP